MIKPTVGRVVWFWESKIAQDHNQPMAAIVAHVWSETTVNLAIFDLHGVPWPKPPTSVRLLQDNEQSPETGHYCSWMPYQIGQANKNGVALNDAPPVPAVE